MQAEIRIPNAKIKKIGNSYFIRVPKYLITTKIIEEDKEYDYIPELPNKNKNSERLIRTTDHQIGKQMKQLCAMEA